MHKAFGVFSRGARHCKLSSPTSSALHAIRINQQSGQEDKEDSFEDQNYGSVRNALMKSAFIGLVMVVGQKIDDTLAHMFSWGNSL